MEVDILEFRVPVENNKTLFVWDIQPSLTEAQIYDGLFAVFSSFGPLYLLKVSPNAPLHPPGFYALIKFYSAAQASKAQRLTDGRPLFQSSPLKVRLSSKQTPHFPSSSSQHLSHNRCLELANHCLGFNGWTSDIVTLKDLASEDDDDDDDEVEEEGGVTRRRLRFGCLMQVSFPQHRQTSRGAAVLEESFTCTGPDVAAVVLQRRCKLQRLVRERALVQAFSAVLLILLGDGKVMVEVKRPPDQFVADHADEVLQVNEFPAREDEIEDDEWDLTVS
ncbi:RAD52 motif-containing protein 1 [Mugil cephalus]|uniref:RAD52 motif-containing protein 1 n=1 Tax=Mugil cephalus TaxID=48193 RepID=UPI001FB6E437|nr:RAD52 motif-containing protein 1 [Mugil cephalus]XP_047428062.1 RAD52 motif-containing protein 1 [Mugil cephalus]